SAAPFERRRNSKFNTVRRRGLAVPWGTPCGWPGEALLDVDELAVIDADGAWVDSIRPLALGVVHQRVGAVDQFRCQLARDAAAFSDRSEVQAHDPDVDSYRTLRQARIVEGPVMPLDRRFKAAGNLDGLGAAREVGDQKAEL